MADVVILEEWVNTRCPCGGRFILKGGFARRQRGERVKYLAYWGPQCNRCDRRYGGQEYQQDLAWARAPRAMRRLREEERTS